MSLETPHRTDTQRMSPSQAICTIQSVAYNIAKYITTILALTVGNTSQLKRFHQHSLTVLYMEDVEMRNMFWEIRCSQWVKNVKDNWVKDQDMGLHIYLCIYVSMYLSIYLV